ncbi:MAG: thioesterase family protein [Sneathiella sp.]
MIENGFIKINKQNVLPEWIDYNGHMNVAFYVMVFDQSLDELLDLIGLTRAYRKESGCSVFVLETHVTYLQEVKEGDPLVMSVRVSDYDEKRMHLFLEMHHETDGFLAATSEQMILHIDSAGPKAQPMPDRILSELEKLHLSQIDALPSPQLGARIGIRRKQAK